MKGTQIQLIKLADCDKKQFAQLCRFSQASVEAWLANTLTPASEIEVTSFIESFDAKGEHAFVVCDAANEYIGLGFLNAINTTHKFCNLGYWISPQFTGKGYATETTKVLLEFAHKKLNLYRVELVIEPDNKASQKVALKAGCVNEGLLKKRIFGKDAYMFACVR
jgi:ribosomal-protein-alanine N-acetyltransferase